MSGYRPHRHVMEWLAMRQVQDLRGPMDTGIGAVETGSGWEAVGYVRRDRALCGCPIAGS
jgi:hypothetical protein